jgi:pimeloyl-ACP methyl ester carboxylesterase
MSKSGKTIEDLSFIHHHQIQVGNGSIHLAEAGKKVKQTILFLHGYPEDWQEFEQLMFELKDEFHLLAIDLPGIGQTDLVTSGDKRSIAGVVNELFSSLDLEQIILAGHDVGGMVTFSFLKYFPEKILKAIIMNTAIPGIFPWEDIKRNPAIWHFSFFAVPNLPEELIAGKQRILFNYFYDTISANKNAIPESSRLHYAKAYDNPASLKTSLDWYRTFPQDEKDNGVNATNEVPVLYLRGDKEYADITKYTEGLRKSGLTKVAGKLIPGCGHFAPEEQPKKVAEAIYDFVYGQKIPVKAGKTSSL